MLPDADKLYESLVARDGRFDGLAFACVKTTGIFCRLTCPARTAKRENVTFRATTNDCSATGFRPCKRCKPEVRPGRPLRAAPR
jgi:methylphosphotriester-DNA--protein-cysteine methyltransferase